MEIGGNNIVTSFKEKPNLNIGWINGGFFLYLKVKYLILLRITRLFSKENLWLNYQKKNNLLLFVTTITGDVWIT